jgi:tRNA (guanine-N7-)-methyltransferase
MIANSEIRTRPLASYGRRRGRRLRVGKQALFDTLLPELQIALPEGQLNPVSLFTGKKSFWLEVGFGGGEHLAHQAQLHPNVGLIGCETYINGIAGLLAQISEHQSDNIRVYTDDARLLIDKLPNRSLEKIFILYPDPWPKARHHKRRLISTKFLDSLARVMKPGAELRLATDYADYCTWMLERLLSHSDFTWRAKGANDWLNPPADWISTRYEQKALAGNPTYLSFVRV